MAKTFQGRTEDATAPFLNAEFWKKGTKLQGVVSRTFQIQNGTKLQNCITLQLQNPVTVDGKKEELVSIGDMAGLRMALQAAGCDELQRNDAVLLECTGRTPSEDKTKSDRVDFAITISRP